MNICVHKYRRTWSYKEKSASLSTSSYPSKMNATVQRASGERCRIPLALIEGPSEIPGQAIQ